MNISPCHVYGPLLLAILLTGCSGQESGQAPEGTAAVMAAQTASTPSTPAGTVSEPDASQRAAPEMHDEPAPQAAMPAAQPAPTGTASTSPAASAAPPAAQANQPDQASLARQAEPALEPVANAAADSDKQHAMATLAIPHATPKQLSHTAMVNHAVTQASAVHSPLATSQMTHASTVLNAQSATALKQQRFASLMTRFHHPAALARYDTLVAPPPTMTTMSLKMGGVGISNFDDVARVNFALKTSDSDWTNNYLDPRDTREFGCGLIGDCLFWMQTGDRTPVYYAMHHEQRYAIFWDQNKAIWDLRLAVQDP
ncbi:hypothetical protein [Rhodanobacter ginsengiterrae]|uniref:hypothetical protein n=1 Tax=Rhodanobacter ginsengiterrae TaxID=2008451 RepID=UPI003CE73564